MPADFAVFPDEELADLGDVKITLTLDFKAITVCESLVVSGELTPMPIIAGWLLLQEMPPISVTGKVLFGLTREHHPEMTLDQIAGMMFGPHSNRLALAMQTLLSRHFDFTQPKAKAKNPRKRRGPSEPSLENG